MGIHTILGAGGAIGNQLLPVLLSNNEQVRLVSRHSAVVPNVESISADITNYNKLPFYLVF
jgi:nucleoside-diphosphate-sugar epimerase